LFEIVIFQIFNCLRHVYSLIRFGRPRHLEIHSDLKKFIAKLTRYLLVFAYSPSPWSFNILNIDVDHLICHIQRASKSDVQLKRHFDLNISPGQIPKFSVEFSSVIRWLFSGPLFSCALNRSQTQEALTNVRSFFDLMRHKKCNGHDCEFHYLRSKKTDINSAQKPKISSEHNRNEATVVFFLCSLIYLCSLIISYVINLPPLFSLILFSITLFSSIFLAWQTRSFLCLLLFPISILIIENTAILGLDKKYFNHEVWKFTQKADQLRSNMYFFVFLILVFFSWKTLTTFDIRSN